MNSYPSWIHRIPEMIEALELHPDDRIDSRAVETLFDLRKTAAFHLLRRVGAALCGHSLLISRGQLLARLRELREHPDWRWERSRRQQVWSRIQDLRPRRRPSVVEIHAALEQQIDQLATAGLPDTVQLAPGCMVIRCRSMVHLVEQLVLVAKALDADYDAMRRRIESPITPKPAGRETRPDRRQPCELAPPNVRL